MGSVPGSCSGPVPVSTRLTFPPGSLLFSHLTDQRTKARRGEVTFSRSHAPRQSVVAYKGLGGGGGDLPLLGRTQSRSPRGFPESGSPGATSPGHAGLRGPATEFNVSNKTEPAVLV